MKLLRHILSHMLLILVMFGIVSLYYYRHQVLPVKYSEIIDSYAGKIHPKLKSFARVKPIQQEITPIEIASQNTVEVPVESVSSEAIVAEVVPEQKVISAVEVPVVDVAVVDASAAEKSTPQSITTVITIEKPANESEITPSVNEVMNNSVEANKEPVEAPATDKEAASTNDLLRAARQAFNDGKLDVAITQYNLLIGLDNDEADFYGELGNVHYAMGSWDKAGVAYYEAATRLIEKRQFAQIRYLQRVLKGLDAERAEKLENLLAQMNY